MSKTAEKLVKNLLHQADISINKDRPGTVRINNTQVYPRLIKEKTLGLGESYMEGWWDSPELDLITEKLLRSHTAEKLRLSLQDIFIMLQANIFNLQAKAKAFEVGEKHYDIGNDLYRAMLDKRMVYSCGYWEETDDLDTAQEHKLELVCRKAQLGPGKKVLDIGCGWGSLAKYAAENYGTEVTGITISQEQADLARNICTGLPVEIKMMDYRDLSGQYDAVISIGMFEHVGPKNYRDFFKMVAKCLKKDGIFLLHTIGANKSSMNPDPWMHKYIFPNGKLPSIRQISEVFEDLFVMEDWHNFGPDYDRTLMSWYRNFKKAWPSLREKYGDAFYRMWEYFLLTSAGGFRARTLQLWQIVLTKPGRKMQQYRNIKLAAGKER